MPERAFAVLTAEASSATPAAWPGDDGAAMDEAHRLKDGFAIIFERLAVRRRKRGLASQTPLVRGWRRS